MYLLIFYQNNFICKTNLIIKYLKFVYFLLTYIFVYCTI